MVATNVADLPFSRIYLLAEGGQKAVLAAASGVASTRLTLPQTIGLDNDPFANVIRSGRPVVLAGGTEAREPGLPVSSSTPGQILLVPIARQGVDLLGLLVARISERLVFDNVNSATPDPRGSGC